MDVENINALTLGQAEFAQIVAIKPEIQPDNQIETSETADALGVAPQYIPIQARTILNRVQAMMPFNWIINPYRGCRHACVYCFARPTHTYYGFDAGIDFHSRIFVKTNAPQLLRKELSRPGWKNEKICLGSVTDPYQPAERRYRLSRRILEVLCEWSNPLEIITKSHLVLDDLELLQELNRRTNGNVSVNISLATPDETKARLIDPGAPSPQKRIEALALLSQAGIKTRLFIMPVLPGITDAPDELETLVQAASRAGVSSVVADTLRLAHGLETYYYAFLEQYYPELLPRYERLYKQGKRTFAADAYRKALHTKTDELRQRYFFHKNEDDAIFAEPSTLTAALEEAENSVAPLTNPQRRSRPPQIPLPLEKQAIFDL